MEYIRNDGNVTSVYSVIIDVTRIEEIIKELETNCFRMVEKSIKVPARNETEAIFLVGKNEDNTFKNIIKVSEGYRGLVKSDMSLNLYECLCMSKERPQLVDILKRLCVNYNYQFGFKNETNHLLDLLYGYSNSDDLKDDSSFDITLLSKLYEEAKRCFMFSLVREEEHRVDKTYKRGASQ